MKLVFDFGGVLFNWRPSALLQRELPHLAVDEASARHWAQAIFQSYEGDWGDFDRGIVSPEALVLRISARTGLSPGEVRRVVDGVPGELQPLPDTVALLEELHGAGRTLFFLSNMPAPFAAHLQASYAFLERFRDGVFSAHVHLAKPERAIFELASRRFGCAPQELLFIDDHLPNVQTARELGWQALHFRDAASCRSELRQLGL